VQKTSAQHTITLTEMKDKVLTLAFSGRLALDNLEAVMDQVRGVIEEKRPGAMIFDLGHVDYLDSAGALALALAKKDAARLNIPVSLQRLSPAAQKITSLVDPRALEAPPLLSDAREGGFVEQVGALFLGLWGDLLAMISFLGDFFIATGRVLRHPRLIRLSEVGLYMQQVGVDGLPIVGLISFLLGLIMAFMSSLQLKSFGANIYVASLVAVAMVHELGPIMTAVLVAGRSGSSFAAEIGTMKVNEEVDALKVMGYDPLVFLALPKMLAALIVVPLLTLYADLTAILGGLLVGILGLDLTTYAYLSETIKSISAVGIIRGIVKAMVFALLIAGIGCQRGFNVRGGAQAVGTATTSAVVAAMFSIIIADSAFAILFYYIW